MNTLKTSVETHTSPLEIFQTAVQTSRQAFLNELKTLPTPLNDLATEQYLSRIKRGNGRAVLGEYAPWLIADLAGIFDKEAIMELMVPWLSIYSYIVFIDDAIDEESLKDRKLLMVAAGLILERGLIKLHRLSVDTQRFLELIDRYFMETATAAVSELHRHRHQLTSYTEDEISSLGRKVAALKLCTIYILSSRGATKIGKIDLEDIDAIGTGIQLLDDVTDWEEDWEIGNYTFPLTLTLKELYTQGIDRASDPRNLKPDEVLAGLIITSALEHSIKRAITLLEKALSKGQVRDGSQAFIFFQRIIDNNVWFAKEIEKARGVLMAERAACQSIDWLEELTKRERTQRELNRVRRIFPIVAQDT